ncbi:STAS domain-containing protein [Sorangium sp. So ce117]|uniref:STAS domain-containing protein n=1 Tax=Sorangium sp. So ce117 TaxID=3133277 RepID=UPI003F5E8A80
MPMHLAQRLAGLELSAIPVWVLDVDSSRVCWVNEAGLDLWRAQDRDELFARDYSTVPAPIRTRFQALAAQLREGGVVRQSWTFYPRGVPVTVTLHSSGVALDDGRFAILSQALPMEGAPEPELVRGIEALRHTSVMIAFVDPSGDLLMQNPAALRAFGRTGTWSAWLGEPGEAVAMLRAALDGDIVARETLVRTVDGERLHVIEGRAVRDPVTGVLGVLFHHTDETARIGAERSAEERGRLLDELNATLALVERQRGEILALSAPILDVGERALALPIIGALNRERSAEIAARLLPAIAGSGVDRVILDMTGAAALDDAGARHLIDMVRTIRLLGASAMITGIQPALARTLVASGFDGTGITLVGSIAQGLSRSRKR